VAHITEQYLSYLDLMRELNLDIAGEYLVMAATLTLLKSRLLLPSPEPEEGEEADLRGDLVRQLLEYQRYREAAQALSARPWLRRDTFVREPSTDLLAYGLSVFLRMHEVPFETVLKAREVIEPALAFEAAANGSDEDFKELEASIARMKALDAQSDQEAFLEENRVFHSVIARASGNKVLEIFWETISILATGEHHGIRYSVGNQTHVIKAHQRILEACRRRDGSAAAAAMEKHVSGLENLVRERYQHLLKHPTSVVERPGRSIA